MKKYVLSMITMIGVILASVQSCFALTNQAVNESSHPPYWLIILIIGTFIWMVILYCMENHHN